MKQNNEQINGISAVQIQGYNLMSENMINLQVKVNDLRYGLIIKFTPEHGVHVIRISSEYVVRHSDKAILEEFLVFLNIIMSLRIPLNPNIH